MGKRTKAGTEFGVRYDVAVYTVNEFRSHEVNFISISTYNCSGDEGIKQLSQVETFLNSVVNMFEY